MKAVTYNNYGSPNNLRLTEVDKPVPKENEVLIKVHTASVNSWDWDLVRGTPFLVRIGGIRKPRFPILGADIAGQIEAVGKKAKLYSVGEAVFGDLSGAHWGGFAEYVCAPENAVMRKPATMSFEDAAAIPQAGALAIQALLYNGKIKQGQKVLINGAGGGVGTFAIQIAKSLGAEVTGVDKGSKFNVIRTSGADHAIDFTKENFIKGGKKYDLIVDVIAYRSLFDYKRLLNPGGAYVMVGGSLKRIFQLMFMGPLISSAGNNKMGLLMHKANKDVDILMSLYAAGKLVPVIDKCYPLSEVAEAVQYLGEGRTLGKVVIRIANS